MREIDCKGAFIHGVPGVSGGLWDPTHGDHPACPAVCEIPSSTGNHYMCQSSGKGKLYFRITIMLHVLLNIF